MSEPTQPNPQKAEAKADESTVFSFDGDDYLIPSSDDWDLDALDQYEQGHDLSFMRLLIGPDQWATFRKKHKNRKQLSDLYEAWQKALNLGN
jgi:hypothetical protein